MAKEHVEGVLIRWAACYHFDTWQYFGSNSYRMLIQRRTKALKKQRAVVERTIMASLVDMPHPNTNLVSDVSETICLFIPQLEELHRALDYMSHQYSTPDRFLINKIGANLYPVNYVHASGNATTLEKVYVSRSVD